MEEGFVLEYMPGGMVQTSWVEGPPQRSFWTGLKVERGTQHPITTYRCAGCGYLESYARIDEQT
jgi:hypothetical protein